jgi:hypothetical protein
MGATVALASVVRKLQPVKAAVDEVRTGCEPIPLLARESNS